MFGWLPIRKPKPTIGVAKAVRGLFNGRTPERPPVAGAASCPLELDEASPHPVLGLLPPGTLQRLLAEGAVAEYPKGTTVFRAGERCDAIFLILSGRCETRLPDDDGIGRIEDVYGPGDMLGARALLTHGPHRATATVITHCVLLRLPAEELTSLFALDPSLAGRFSLAVGDHVETLRKREIPQRARSRRIVALLPLAARLDAGVVVRQLATALFQIAGRRVLILRFGGYEDLTALPLAKTSGGREFRFSRQIRTLTDGCDELRLAVRNEASDTAAIAPLLSHCGRHYDYVLLELAPETPAPATLEALIQSDLGYVLIEPGTQHLYDFRLLLGELAERCRGACSHVRPILFAGESIAAPEVRDHLRELGHPVHSIVRGFPIRDGAETSERRFQLALNRLAREIARCRVGLALSSGGAKGLAHIGVIQVLEENGIEIDCITGASMGAYVGAIWAYGLDGTQLEKVARENEGRWGLLNLFDPVIPPRRGFIRTRRTAARLRRSIGDVHFSELVRPLRVLATHLDTLERVVFSTGEVASAVEASIAIPGVCVPVTIDGQTYIDGGISDPLPVDVLQELGIERLIAVNVIPPPERIRYWLDAARETNGRAPKRRWLGRVADTHFNYLASGNILDTMMRAINGAQTRVAEAAAREADVVLRPLSGGAQWHDFTHPQKYIALGRAVAEAQIDEIKALVGTQPNEPKPPIPLEPALAA
jgi:NTE family protein